METCVGTSVSSAPGHGVQQGSTRSGAPVNCCCTHAHMHNNGFPQRVVEQFLPLYFMLYFMLLPFDVVAQRIVKTPLMCASTFINCWENAGHLQLELHPRSGLQLGESQGTSSSCYMGQVLFIFITVFVFTGVHIPVCNDFS